MKLILLIKFYILALGFVHLDGYSQTSLHTVKYDKVFKSSASRWMPGISYKWLKAQCWQESRFDSYAVSPAGAAGFCQFMPQTADEVSKALNYFSSPFSIKWSIEAAAYYDSKMLRFWTTKRPLQDKINLALASYNAGAGNLAKAQKACDMSVLYEDIIECLPLITRHHSNETVTYVRKINKYFNIL